MASSRKTICLNMIVKNEAGIITSTLNNILDHINIDYWVISDTGSTDNTKEVICNFFKKKNIKGELIEHKWQDFAWNRTKALECAFNKTDYLLIFDADDSFDGTLVLPDLTKDSYNLKIGDGVSYYRPLLITNRKRWCFKGVLHEFLTEIDSMNGADAIDGDYHIVSGRFGNRSKNPTKYLDDAIILKNAYNIEEDKGLACRYAFYCAQSYKDAGELYRNDAIEWYKKVLELNNWAQEKYYSCIMLGNFYNEMKDYDNAYRYWIKSSNYDNERIEGIVSAMEYLRSTGENLMVALLYNKFKNYNKNISKDKLFLDRSKYNDMMEYNNSICSYYLDSEKHNGYECCKKIIMNNTSEKYIIDSTLSNLMFYKEFMEKDEDKTLYNRLIKKDEIIPAKLVFTKDECRKSKNILFYTGFSYNDWNYSYIMKNSIGGSEKAVAYLTKHLSKEYNIYISGGVINEKIDNITYIHLYQLQDLINTTAFHTIICSRYIAFFEMFKDISYFQYYIWAHDTNLLPYAWPNQSFTDKEIITKWDKSIDGCICQTKWHAEEYKKLYPELKDKIKIINNGIDTSLFYNNKKKIKNRFIYTSRSERGLITLLEMWREILEKFPDATLIISSYGKFPDNDQDNMMKKIIDNYDSISHIGSLSSDDLYNEMMMSEYWVYPTSYQETSCITAMEMLANGVICIYYPVAGLVDTMKDYGIAVNNKNEILDTLVNLDDQKKNKMIEDGIKYATTECSWHMRAKEWTKLFSRNKMIQVINLKRRTDRRDAMVKQFADNNITDYDFFEAVDGKELKPTQEIKKMFEGNDFNYMRGVIGCAMSHYNLWTQLVNDNANDFYLIMEDDITICKGFNNHIQKYYDEMKNKEIIFFGYSRSSSEERMIAINTFNNINNNTATLLENLSLQSFGGGAFGYSINKSAAIKYIDYININGITRAIDYIFLKTDEPYRINPSIIITEHYCDGKIDTNIQYDYDSLEFTRNKMIQVINLKRRPDRRDAMIKQFQDNNITDYDFFEAVDGKELKPTQEIKKMFEGNDFNYRRGVIGCALSHYNLWTQLINDSANDFYLIMEDDIIMCKGFNNHIQKYYDEMKNKEIIFFGYFAGSCELRGKVIDDFNNINNDTVFILEDSNKYSSGLFCYSINKPAAIKYIEHINKNSIRNALDVFIECNKITTISIINPSLVISSFVYDLVGDTNIQYDYDSLEFIDSNKNYIYINSFWYGFLNKADPNNISYLKRLISKTKLHNYEITDDIANANILIESLSIFGSNSLVNYKKWKYKIHYSGESFANNNTDYDIVLDSKNTENNIIALPLFVYYINGNNLFDKILNRGNVHDVPVNFCCFISSNPHVIQRRTMFEKLNNYKKVDSYGRYHNNMDNITISPNWWSDEYIQLLSKYKFMISFENTKCKNYITEKFVNPLLARTIPIYWGSDHVKTVFNPGSFLFLEDDTPESYDNLIQQIIDLDTNDEKYLEFINRPIFNNLDYWNNHYTDNIIAANIDKLL